MSSSDFHEFIDFSSSTDKSQIHSTGATSGSNLSLSDLGLKSAALEYAKSKGLSLGATAKQVVSWMILGESCFVVDTDHQSASQAFFVSMLHLLAKKEIKPVVVFAQDSQLEEFKTCLKGQNLSLDTVFSVKDDWKSSLDKENPVYFILDKNDQEQTQQIYNTLIEESRSVGSLTFVVAEQSLLLKEAFTAISRKIKFFYSEPQFIKGEFVEHETFNCALNKKHNFLAKLIGERQGVIKVYVNSKYDVDDLANKLKADEAVEAKVYSWGFRPKVSDKIFLLKKKSETSVIVGTEKALSEFFVDAKTTVVNFDLPTSSESFIDRVAPSYISGGKNAVVSLACEDHGVNIASINRELDEGLHIKNTIDVGDEFVDPEFKRKTKEYYKALAAKDREARNSRDGRSPRGGGRPNRDSRPDRDSRPNKDGDKKDGYNKSSFKERPSRDAQPPRKNNRPPLTTTSARKPSRGPNKGSNKGSRRPNSSLNKKGDISSVGDIRADSKNLAAAKSNKGMWSKFKGFLGIDK